MAITKLITIDGETVAEVIQNSFPLLERLDERLDMGNITVDNIERREDFPMFAKVEITLTDTFGNILNFSYRVSSDLSILTTKNPNLYTHNIKLIEPTAVLNYKTMSTQIFTQPTDGTVRYFLDDVIDKIANTTPLRLTAHIERDKLFTLDETNRAEIETIPAPQLYLIKPILREALNEVLKYVNAVCRLDNNGILTFDYFNKLNNEIPDAFDSVESEQLSQDIQLYATSLESDMENVVVESNPEQGAITYPNTRGFMTPRSGNSGDVAVSLTTAIYELPFPIYIMKKVELGGVFTSLDETAPVQFLALDITKYVVEEEIFSTLSSDDAIFDAPVKVVKKNVLRYNRFQNTIFGLGETSGIWETTVAIENVIKSAIVEYNAAIQNPDPFSIDGHIKFLFGPRQYDSYSIRVTYVPSFNSRIRIEKENISSINKDSQIIINQSNHIISLEAYLINLYGKSQRIGNPTVEITQTISDFSKIYNLNDYIGDFIITEREIVVYDSELKVNYRFDKSFNRLSEYIGVNAEKREYEIPNSNKTFRRSLLYKNYIEVSTTLGNSKEGIITAAGQRVFMQTFLDFQTSSKVLNAYLTLSDTGQFTPLVPTIANGVIKEDIGGNIGIEEEILMKDLTTDDASIINIITTTTSQKFGIQKFLVTYTVNVSGTILKTTEGVRTAEIITRATAEFVLNTTSVLLEFDANSTNSFGYSFTIITGQQLVLTFYFKESFASVLEEFTVSISTETQGDPFNEELLLGATANGGANTLIFSFGFPTNQLAGNQVVFKDSKWVMEPIRYTREDGTLENYRMQLVGELPFEETETGIELAGKKLPIYEGDLHNILFDTGTNIQVQKDSGEILAKTFQLDIFKKAEDVDKIIIGRFMTANNALVSDINDGILTLYVSNERYNKFDTLKAKGTPLSGVRYDGDTNNGIISINNIEDVENYTSWALANANGNLYIAANQLDGPIEKIQFNFLGEHNPEIDYNWTK